MNRETKFIIWHFSMYGVIGITALIIQFQTIPEIFVWLGIIVPVFALIPATVGAIYYGKKDKTKSQTKGEMNQK